MALLSQSFDSVFISFIWWILNVYIIYYKYIKMLVVLSYAAYICLERILLPCVSCFEALFHQLYIYYTNFIEELI